MVEPNPGILIVARNVLTRAGHSVLAVAQAEEGIHLAKSERIDAVLLDARQADRHLLSALHAKRRVPVILTFQRGKPIAGRADVDMTQPGVDTAEFLEKPFAPERLLRTVNRVIEDPAGPRPASFVREDSAATSARPASSSPQRRASSSTTSGRPPSSAGRRPSSAGRPASLAATVSTPLSALRRAATPRRDTTVSADADYEDFADNDQTDIFPYAHLLDTNRGHETLRDVGAARDARAAQLSEHLRAFLEMEGLEPRPGILSACLRACDAYVESATDLHPIPIDDDAVPAIEGVIPALSIDQVLQLAMAVGQPSRCRIAQDGAAIDVFYEDGNVTFARHIGLPDGFLLGQFLIASGRVREPALLAALNAPRDGSRVGERLVSRGEITDADLAAALRMQTEELVYEVVRWSTGRFAIFAGQPLPYEARRVRLKLAMPHLLLEGMRRLDEWRRMRTSVGDLGSVLGRRDVSPSSLARLSDEDRDVLKYVDGRRTVAELVRSVSRPTFHVYRSLHSLAGRRLVATTPR